MRNVFWGTILITFGVLFLLDNLEIADVGDVIHDYWPLILIIWGGSILIRKKKAESPQGEWATGSATVAEQVKSDLVHQSNVFGDVFAAVVSQSFKGGSVSTVFGDCDVDLSKSVFAEGEHILRVHSVFGNSTIILPPESAVSIDANTVLGNVIALGQRKEGFSPSLNVNSAPYASSRNRMKIIATKVFGDVRIS